MAVWNVGAGSSAPLARSPVTIIYKAYPLEQPTGGYWTAFFHAGYWLDVSFPVSSQRYWGFHPYPSDHLGDVTDPATWEIATQNDDYLGVNVTFGEWRTVVGICNGQALTMYTDWDAGTSEVVTHTDTHTNEPTDPALIMGDAPWNRGREVFSGVIRGIQVYDAVLTETQINQELASPGAVRTPWYLNLNPTPTDISDKSGNGNDPIWVGAGRPTLWTP